MMPRKFVEERDPSPPATCRRMLGNWLVGYHCGSLMEIVVTQNPLSDLPYMQLVVVRCIAGHIESGVGVVQEEPHQ